MAKPGLNIIVDSSYIGHRLAAVRYAHDGMLIVERKKALSGT